MHRQQKGSIIKRSARWYLTWWEKRTINGQVERKRVSAFLGPVTTRGKRPPADIVEAARKHMQTVNAGSISAENIVTLGDFVEGVYLPWAERELRRSTTHGYRSYWSTHLKALCANLTLKDVKAHHVQQWLDAAAAKGLSRNSLLRLKSCISGIFNYALQKAYFEGINPAIGTRISRHAMAPRDGHNYTLDDARRILAVLPAPADAAFALAVFAGLRISEIKALRWEDIRDGHIHVNRSIVNCHVEETKTESSKAAVPVITHLAQRLERHRLRCGDPDSGWVFANSIGDPFNLDNLCARVMRPALAKAGITWHGWHAGRRGIATILKDLGADDLTVQQILRHSDVGVTRKSYIKRLDQSVSEAMQQYDSTLRETQRRLNAEPAESSTAVN